LTQNKRYKFLNTVALIFTISTNQTEQLPVNVTFNLCSKLTHNSAIRFSVQLPLCFMFVNNLPITIEELTSCCLWWLEVKFLCDDPTMRRKKGFCNTNLY